MSAPPFFYIPSRLEDLENEAVLPAGAVCARPVNLDHLEAGQYAEEITEYARGVGADGVGAAVEGSHFGRLYTLLRCLGEMKGDEAVLFGSVMARLLMKACEAHTSAVAEEDTMESTAVYTSIKIFGYSLTRIITFCEKAMLAAAKEESAELFTTGKRKKPAGKGGPRQANSTEELDKERCLEALVSSVSLASVPRHDQTYLSVILGVAVTLLESPTNVKGAARSAQHLVKDAIFELLRILARNEASPDNDTTEHLVGAALADLIARCEHIPKHAALFCRDVAAEGTWGELFFDRTLAGACDVATTLLEGPEAKNVGTFLVELGEVQGAAMLKGVARLLETLSSEAHSVRKAVLAVVTNVVVLHGQNNTTTVQGRATARTKGELLHVLAERTLDTQPWVRVAVLHNIKSLFQSRCLNVAEQRLLLTSAVSRISDRNSFVRHAAMGCVKVVLANNLVGDVLRIAVFRSYFDKKYSEVEAVLGRETTQTFLARSEELGEADVEYGSTMAPEGGVVGDDLVRLFYYHTACGFIADADAAVKTILLVLTSKSTNDVVEAIHLLSTMIRFKVTAAVDSVMKICVQVFNREQAVGEAVVRAFLDIVSGSEVTIAAKSETHRARLVAHQVIRSLHNATEGGISSIKKILSLVGVEFCEQIADVTFEIAEAYEGGGSAEARAESRGAMLLFALLSESCPEVVQQRLTDISALGVQRVGLTLGDQNFAQHTCTALTSARLCSTFTALPPNHEVFYDICLLILSQNASFTEWVPLARSALKAVYTLCEAPERVVTELTKKLSTRYVTLRNMMETEEADVECTSEGNVALQNDEEKTNVEEEKKKGDTPTNLRRLIREAQYSLGRLLFILGETALRQLAFVEAEYKATMVHIHATTTATTPSPKRSKKKKEKEDENIGIEAELGLDSKGALETNAEHTLREGQGRILSDTAVWGRCINLVLRSALRQDAITVNVWVKSTATLALAMYMMVTEEFAAAHAQHLFSLLQAAREGSIRANLIISVGDLLTRWPNTMEPWTPHFFATLRDPDVQVRSTAFLVSSHLILNDMLKARGFAHILLAGLIDPHEAVQERASVFLHEFATRDRIFTGLPDILSAFAREEGLTVESLRTILKQMLPYIDKEKQLEALVGRLCLKFTQTTAEEKEVKQGDEKEKDKEKEANAEGEQNEAGVAEVKVEVKEKEKEGAAGGHSPLAMRQARFIAECLALLELKQNSERPVKKLTCEASFKCYLPYLGDQSIVALFKDIADKVRKVVPGVKERAEVKALADEWEVRLDTAFEKNAQMAHAEKNVETRSAAHHALQASKQTKRAQARKRKTRNDPDSSSSSPTPDKKRAKKTPASRKRRASSMAASDSESTVPTATPAKRRKPAAKSGRKKASPKDSSSEEDTSEEESSETPKRTAKKKASKKTAKKAPQKRGRAKAAVSESSSDSGSEEEDSDSDESDEDESEEDSSESTPAARRGAKKGAKKAARKPQPKAKRGRRVVAAGSDSSDNSSVEL